MTATGTKWVSPTAIAKELDIKPQMIYSWIKSGAVKVKPNSHPQLVDEASVRDRAMSYRPKGSRAPAASGESVAKGGSSRAPLKKGDMFSYHPRRRGSRPVIAQVTSVDNSFTRFNKSTHTPGQILTEAEWRNETLNNLIERKVVAILSPMQVLRMVAQQFAFTGNMDRALRLKAWLENEQAIYLREKGQSNGGSASSAAKADDKTPTPEPTLPESVDAPDDDDGAADIEDTEN